MDETIQRLVREFQRAGKTVEEIVNTLSQEFTQDQKIEAINVLLRNHNQVRQEAQAKYWNQDKDPRCETCNHPKSWHFGKENCAGIRPRLMPPIGEDPRGQHYVISTSQSNECGDCS